MTDSTKVYAHAQDSPCVCVCAAIALHSLSHPFTLPERALHLTARGCAQEDPGVTQLINHLISEPACRLPVATVQPKKQGEKVDVATVGGSAASRSQERSDCDPSGNRGRRLNE